MLFVEILTDSINTYRALLCDKKHEAASKVKTRQRARSPPWTFTHLRPDSPSRRLLTCLFILLADQIYLQGAATHMPVL